MSDEPGRRKPSASAPAATPEEILRLLETCQLSEQDTDELLKDAYALNRLLRAHLAHVEAPSGGRTRAEAAGASVASASGGGGGGSGSFGRQLSGPERHAQSVSRRSVSLSGRPPVAVAAADGPQQQQQRLPPIRARSPGQRLSEMARVYSSGVIQQGHRAGDGGGGGSAVTSSKKRL